jgi:hypothetical protein
VKVRAPTLLLIAMKSISPTNSLWHFAGVFAIACIWVFVASALEGQICAVDEFGTVCLRNWISAGGSIAALIIATAAAIFSFGQYKAAQVQAVAASSQAIHAALPILNSSISMLNRADSAVRGMLAGLSNLSKGVTKVADLVTKTSTDVDLLVACHLANGTKRFLDDHYKEAYSIYYNDPLDEASKEALGNIIQIYLSISEETTSALVAIQRLGSIDTEPLSTFDTPEIQLKSNIVRRSGDISAAAEELSTKHSEMLPHFVSLTGVLKALARERKVLMSRPFHVAGLEL